MLSGQSPSSPEPSTTRPFPIWPLHTSLASSLSIRPCQPLTPQPEGSICSSPNAAHSSLAAHYVYTLALPSTHPSQTFYSLIHHCLNSSSASFHKAVSDSSHGTPSMSLPKNVLPSHLTRPLPSKYGGFTDPFLQTYMASSIADGVMFRGSASVESKHKFKFLVQKSDQSSFNLRYTFFQLVIRLALGKEQKATFEMQRNQRGCRCIVTTSPSPFM